MISSFNCTGVFKQKLFTSLEIMTFIVINNYEYKFHTSLYAGTDKYRIGFRPHIVILPLILEHLANTELQTNGICTI